MIKKITPQDRRIFSSENQNHLVMKCNPLALVLFKDFRSSHCNYCLLQRQTNRCSICKSYFYCSATCQKLDWKLHKAECQILSKVNKELPCNLLLLLRIYINGIEISEFYGNIDKDCDQMLYQQFQDCTAFLMKLLENSDIEKLMETQIKIQLNSFTITDISGDSLGVGIYSPANYFNHKCIKSSPDQINVANCSHFFNNRELIVITNDSFQNKGTEQELTLSYANIINYKQRQQFLKEQYRFLCDCDRCLQESKKGPNEEQQKLKSEEYLTLLNNKKFKAAFKILEELIESLSTYYDNQLHPYIGWKMNEASKLAFHLNYLIKSESYSIKAIKLLEPYYSERDEFKELVGRLKDVQSEIKMTK